MTRPDLLWRLGGAALFGLACVTSLLHRQIQASTAAGPPTALEMALGLTSFVLASAGMLLIVQGARLRRDWAGAMQGRRSRGPARPGYRARRR